MKSHQIDMTTGAIFPKLMKFALPLILSSLLQLLFNAADIVVVSWAAGDNSMAAVGATSALVNLLVNFFLGLSVGSNVLSANFFGAKNTVELKKTVHTSVALSFVVGLLVTLVGMGLSEQILKLMDSPENVLPLSTLYLKVFFSGITATVVYNFGSALLRAKGDTKRPLFILLIAGIINVILNIIFVVGLKTYMEGVAGVALATVLSQCFAAIWILRILSNENDDFKLNFKNLRIHKDILLRIIKIGLPAGIQSALFSFSNVVIQSTVNSFGEICVAGNSACQSIEGFVYITMNCIAQSCLTFTGQNMGAHKIDRIKKIFATGLVGVIASGLILGGLVLAFDDALVGIYTSNPLVISSAKERFFVICGTYYTCGMMDVAANSLRGMGYSFIPMIVTLIGACGLRIVYLFTVFRLPGMTSYQNIFWSYPISWVLTFVALTIGFVFIVRRLERNC